MLELEAGEGLVGLGRGIAFQIGEALGVLERARVANDLKTLDQAGRAALRKFGVRFGAYHLYLPLLLKPAPRSLAAQLWALKHGGIEGVKGLDEVPHLAASGRTSFAADKDIDRRFYLAAGFRVSGERAVRVDILERLADLIRPAINYRPGQTPGEPPAGSADRDGFVVTVAMTSLAGCSGEQFASILKSLNYVAEKRKGPAITVALLPAAPTTPVVPTAEIEPAEPAEQADAPEATAEAADVSEARDATVAAEENAPVAEASVEAAPEPAAVEPEPVTAPQATEPNDPEVPPAEAAATEDAAAAEPAAEAPEIEVWHPARRHQHHGPRQGNRPQRDGQRPGGPRPEGQRNFRGARRDQPAQTPAEGETPAPAAEGAQENRRPDHRRDQRPDHRGPRREGGGEKRPFGDRPPRPEGQGRPDRKPGEGRPGGRTDFKGNRDRRPDRGGPSERQFASTEKPRGRDKAPDPDSPFAKLAALKAQLEGKKP